MGCGYSWGLQSHRASSGPSRLGDGGFISSTGAIGPRSQAEGRSLPGACRLLGRPHSRSAGRPGPTPWALQAVSRVGGHSEPWLLSLGAGVLQSQRGCLEEASRGDEFPK